MPVTFAGRIIKALIFIVFINDKINYQIIKNFFLNFNLKLWDTDINYTRCPDIYTCSGIKYHEIQEKSGNSSCPVTGILRQVIKWLIEGLRSRYPL